MFLTYKKMLLCAGMQVKLKYFIQKRILLLFFLLTAFVGAMQHRKGWNTVITSDGVGYYSYLPALFIYQDADYNFLADFRREYQPVHEFIRDFKGEKVNQYFVGVAVLQLPFFLVAHSIALVSGTHTNGFSPLYQVAVWLSGLFYLFWGLHFLRKLLLRFHPQESWVHISLAAVLLGTNLFNYSGLEISYSHVYSFAVITLFFYTVLRWAESGAGRYLLAGSIALAFVAIIRPSNLLLVLAVPFFARQNIIPLLRQSSWKHYVPALVTFTCIVMLQPLAWCWQTGAWVVDAYTTARFEFSHPHLLKVLFSYQKGWFVYTPLALFSLAGFVILFRQKVYGRVGLLLYLLLNAYVISSWNFWHYGVTFGQRPFVDSYSVHALLMLFVTASVSTRTFLFRLWVLLIGLLCFLNLFQNYQYRINIIHGKEMNRELYWKVFLKLGQKYRFLVQKAQGHPCSLATDCDTLYLPQQGAGISPGRLQQGACLQLGGTFSSSNKETDASMYVKLFAGGRLLASDQVYFFRYIHDSSQVFTLYHPMVVAKTWAEADSIQVELHDPAAELNIQNLYARFCR